MPVTRYLYHHPDGAGLGEATAGADDLAERPIFPGQEATAGQNMAALDMPSGTVVELDIDDDPDSPGFGGPHRDDDADLEIVNWTDQFGIARRTSVDPKFFRAHFSEVDE
jgi:hypothetical protein